MHHCPAAYDIFFSLLSIIKYKNYYQVEVWDNEFLILRREQEICQHKSLKSRKPDSPRLRI